jgi:hypothetical protein
MTEPDAGQDARNPYLSTNIEHEAQGSLEATAFFLEAIETDPDMWKWAVVALHNAVQGFMVLALTHGTNWGTLQDQDIARKVQADFDHRRALQAGDAAATEAANAIMLWSPSKLAPFLTLYARIKNDDWPMTPYMGSIPYEPRPTDDSCMRNLNSVRNEFAHFVPLGRHFLLTQFPAMTETELHIISFLVNESGNIHLRRTRNSDDPDERFKVALTRAKEALDRITAAYEGLPLPVAPLCGSPVEETA